MKPLKLASLAAGAAMLFAAPIAAHACSACGCTLGTEFAGQDYSLRLSGWRLGLRYDFVDQNQLRLGSKSLDKSTYIPDDPDQEVQQGTLSRFYTASADYTVNGDWGLNIQLPYLDREHETEDVAGDPQSTSHLYGIGDLRVLGRYQGFSKRRNFGIQFGLKLPTGPTHGNFSAGPAQGEQVDRGLQPGSGTTDVLLGAYDTGSVGTGWSRFEQIQYKQALNSCEGFRPSSSVTLNLGVSYLAHPVFVPQMQINLRWEGRELGENADYPNSGDRAIFLSPGASLRLRGSLQLYGFLQLPVYQYYTGLQLAPQYTVSAGLSLGL